MKAFSKSLLFAVAFMTFLFSRALVAATPEQIKKAQELRAAWSEIQEFKSAENRARAAKLNPEELKAYKAELRYKVYAFSHAINDYALSNPDAPEDFEITKLSFNSFLSSAATDEFALKDYSGAPQLFPILESHESKVLNVPMSRYQGDRFVGFEAYPSGKLLGKLERGASFWFESARFLEAQDFKIVRNYPITSMQAAEQKNLQDPNWRPHLAANEIPEKIMAQINSPDKLQVLKSYLAARAQDKNTWDIFQTILLECQTPERARLASALLAARSRPTQILAQIREVEDLGKASPEKAPENLRHVVRNSSPKRLRARLGEYLDYFYPRGPFSCDDFAEALP